MRISELARRSGIAPTAVRFYESAGILPPAPRTESGYREYDEADLCRLRLVVALRGLGLELEESGRLASMCSAGRCDEMTTDLRDRLAERRREVAAARAELDHLERELANLERQLDSGEPVSTLCLEKGDVDDP